MEKFCNIVRSTATILRKIVRYLAGLEWTEKKQDVCRFCDHQNFQKIVYQDDHTIAFENARLAGQLHWLLIPVEHVRDVEALTGEHVHLLERLEDVKTLLLERYCPDVSPSVIHSGYHRGRRPLVGSLFWPDIVSIHHLHLHVIVETQWYMKLFKYPAWLPLMWKSDEQVMREAQMKHKKASSSQANFKID
ncbi:histidine triad-like motif-containing protein [Zopfia rhizophila CBS 207.26]|uniref:Histidine triad-like motif-containing protein n=1 Tax=Zopfia rhizophila CBS 207.26 TaxID=1314779 RepID=A0A6A6DRX5_9PEZI|nr:histidine triad-like motif-containing protein [Zopfia rhizophila CBS 207.26]